MENYSKQTGRLLFPFLFFLFMLCFPIVTQAQNGTLTGKVIDELNNPVVNFWVDVFDCISNPPSYTNGYKASGKTNSIGVYTISLPAGCYRVGLIFGTNYVDEWYDDKPQYNSDGVVLISLASGETKELNDAKLVLAVNGSISGAVTKAAGGDGIENVTVYAYNSNGGWKTSPTDKNGEYTITGLPPGTYTVYFGAFNTPYVSKWYDDLAPLGSPDPVTVTGSVNTPNINAQLDLGGSISGKVTIGSPTGTPLQNAWIDVCDSTSTVCTSSSPTWRGYDRTDVNGEYAVSGLPVSGSFKVQFFEKTVSNAGAGATQFYNNKQDISSANTVGANSQNIDAVFGASISGVVTKSGGGALADIVVKVYDSSGNLVASSSATQADGKYTVSGLSTGEYTLFFDATATPYVSEWHDNKTAPAAPPVPADAAAVPITSLGDKLTVNAELVLDTTGSISGKVFDRTTKPIAGALIKVYDNSKTLRSSATTSSTGTYTATGLSAGIYNIQFFESKGSGAGEGLNEWYSDKLDFINANAVTVLKGKETKEIDAMLGDPVLTGVYNLLLLKQPVENNIPAVLPSIYTLLLKEQCIDENGTPVACNQ